MADRVVKVSLTAQVSNYVAGMEQARKATADSSKASEDASAKFAAQNQAMTTIGTGLLAIGTLAAVGVGLAIKKFADFDEAMSFVAAATHETADNMNLLRDAALDAGARTVFSATESANAIEELGRAGLTTADILGGGLDGALSLAAAGGLGVADAAGIAAVALKTFKLEGSDMTHVADLLAAGAGKAMGDVTDLASALAQSGQVAASTGLTIEETTATLSAFAAQGLLGSDAGTSFKSMLQRLTPVSAESKKEMDRLGISAYDAQGNFIGMEKFAGNLQDSLKGLTVEQRNAALAQIFGSDAVRAATVLYSEGADGIAKWEASVNDAGYAAETAATRLDNLKGDVEQLGGAFDTALITTGSASDDALRLLVQTATNLLDVFNGAPVSVQQATLALGVLVAGVALAGGAFLVAIPKIAEYRTAIEVLGPTAQRASAIVGTSMKALGIVAAIGVAVAAVTALTGAMKGAGVSSEELANVLNNGKIRDGVKAAFDSAAWFGAELGQMNGAIEDLGGTLDSVSGTMDTRWAGALSGAVDWMDLNLENTDRMRDGLQKLGDSLGSMPLADAQSAMRKLRDEYSLTDEQIMTLIDQSGPFKDSLVAAASETGQLADNQTLLKIALQKTEPEVLSAADAYLETSDKSAALDDKITTLIDSMNILNGVGLDASAANIAYQQTLDDLDAQIALNNSGAEGYATTLDIGTEAGRNNRSMLDDLAKGGRDAADAQFQLDGDTAAYKLTLEAGHQAVYDRAIALGANADEAKRIADEISAIPDSTQWKAIIDVADADNKIRAFINRWNGNTINLNTAVSGRLGSGILGPDRAAGGILPGAPSATDNMYIHAASGEFITNASSTADPANRRALEFMNAGGSIQGYANGGMVRPQYVTGGGGTGGSSYTTSGDTFNASFQLSPVGGRSLADQAFEASRRMKLRR